MAPTTLIPVFPSEADVVLARETSLVLAAHRKTSKPLRLRLVDGPAEGTIGQPASVVVMLVRILEELGGAMR